MTDKLEDRLKESQSDIRVFDVSLIPEEQLLDKNCVIQRVVDSSGKVIYDREKGIGTK